MSYYLSQSLIFDSDKITYQDFTGDTKEVMMDWEDTIMSSSAAYALGTNSSTNGMMLQGFVGDDSHGFAKGVPLYLTTSGQLSTTVPASTGNVVRIMGYAVDDDTLYFDPDKTFVVRS